jgi:hypothetical protein
MKKSVEEIPVRCDIDPARHIKFLVTSYFRKLAHGLFYEHLRNEINVWYIIFIYQIQLKIYFSLKK